MQEKENALRILQEAKDAIKNNDSIKLKLLSNQTNNTASLTQDPDNIAVAVAVYSISKIVERVEYRTLPGWKDFYKTINSAIDNSISAIKKNDDAKLTDSLISIRDAVSKLSGRLKDYIQDVFRKAQINKASKIYEHGISMEQTANLLGITLFELATYSGQKPEGAEAPLAKTLDVKSRIKTAMDLFR
ncbi:MAG: hypothetical protein PHQ66_02410 [Candidatus Nanoarchaeia archaeon]|nr:hypothetical protein [Candidatus Nanoarchaeia archaeon]MDD5357778.1 hypothetical protein [Candidatus Nanoarchaeia archaeon]MDD5588697.1 hypothetical protein [Candidatus Nanoarchaeia archaeon]